MGENWSIEVVCTDRGQHKRTWITRMSNDGDGWRSVIVGKQVKHDMFGPPLHDAPEGGPTSREAYGFACSRCNRWPRIAGSRWIALMDGARRVGHVEFDVSYLD